MDADFMGIFTIRYAAAFAAAAVILGAHLGYALELPPIYYEIAEKIPAEAVPYVRGAIALLILLFIGLIHYGIKYLHSRMDLPMPENNSEARQPVRGAQAESAYIASKRKFFEDAETEYLAEKLREAKRKIK